MVYFPGRVGVCLTKVCLSKLLPSRPCFSFRFGNPADSTPTWSFSAINGSNVLFTRLSCLPRRLFVVCTVQTTLSLGPQLTCIMSFRIHWIWDIFNCKTKVWISFLWIFIISPVIYRNGWYYNIMHSNAWTKRQFESAYIVALWSCWTITVLSYIHCDSAWALPRVSNEFQTVKYLSTLMIMSRSMTIQNINFTVSRQKLKWILHQSSDDTGCQLFLPFFQIFNWILILMLL